MSIWCPWKKSKGGTLLCRKIFDIRFCSNFMCQFPRAKAFYMQNLSKIRDKKFFDIEGSPLWIRKKFLSPIWMKIKIWNTDSMRITHTKFEQNQRQNFFFEIEGSPLWIKKNFWLRFWWNSKFLILMALGSYIQNFSKIGDKNFFDIEGSPLWIFQKIRYLLNDFRGKWSAGHTSRY